jgi:hypothetical protein
MIFGFAAEFLHMERNVIVEDTAECCCEARRIFREVRDQLVLHRTYETLFSPTNLASRRQLRTTDIEQIDMQNVLRDRRSSGALPSSEENGKNISLLRPCVLNRPHPLELPPCVAALELPACVAASFARPGLQLLTLPPDHLISSRQRPMI